MFNEHQCHGIDVGASSFVWVGKLLHVLADDIRNRHPCAHKVGNDRVGVLEQSVEFFFWIGSLPFF